jgi:hypothetical protein
MFPVVVKHLAAADRLANARIIAEAALARSQRHVS